MLDNYTNAQLRNSMRAAAQSDAIVAEEEDLRCYTFDPNWEAGAELATFSNGSGDGLIIVFRGEAAIIKGFDHESEVSPHVRDGHETYPGIYGAVPEHLLNELRHDALNFDEVTFCLWRENTSGKWSKGSVALDDNEDGAAFLLSCVVTSFEDYRVYAKDYFERDYTKEMEEQTRQFFCNAL